MIINKIREKRRELDYTQDYVASMLNKTRGWFGKIESSDDPALVLKHIDEIAIVLESKPEELYSIPYSQTNNNSNQQGGITGVINTNNTVNITVSEELLNVVLELLKK